MTRNKKEALAAVSILCALLLGAIHSRWPDYSDGTVPMVSPAVLLMLALGAGYLPAKGRE